MISRKWILAMTLLLIAVMAYIASQWNSTADNMLLEASGVGDLKRVEDALKSGAHVDVRDFDRGATPLILASGRDHLEIVMKLVVSGADLNKKDGGGSPLYYACLRRNKAIVSYLRSAGAKLVADKESLEELRLDKEMPSGCGHSSHQ